MADRIGQQLGSYRLIRLLGQGSFAEVYLGEHIQLGTNAAVKVLRASPGYISQEDFRNEALLLARLAHPHIERIFDFGVEDTVFYLATEYAPAGTLRDRHPGGSSLTPAQTFAYVWQVASALQYLHDRNIIHCDVKPDNILLKANDKVLLSGLGVAAFTPDRSLNSPTITASSSITGNAMYIAPEQIQGRPVRASDQYALAIVAYELLTGKAPFRGISIIDTIIKQLNEPPPSLRAINPGIPRQAEEVVMTALAKDPQHRFASVEEFAAAFEQAVRLSQPAGSAPFLQGIPPAPGKTFETDPYSRTQPASLEPDDYSAGSTSLEMTSPFQPYGGTPSRGETPPVNPTPVTPAMSVYPRADEQTGKESLTVIKTFSRESLMASRRPSIARRLGNALKKIVSSRKGDRQQATELSLFAIARTTVDDTTQAIVGNTYTIEAGISQNRPDGFRGEPVRVRAQNAVDPLVFDILIHPGDNIELIGTAYQRLHYNPGSAEPQFITCPFRLKAPGRCQLIVHFYRERQWLKAIRFEFEGIPQPRSVAVTGGG